MGADRPAAGPPTINQRHLVNATLYLLRTGCQWRMLPIDFPNWNTVRYHVDNWQRTGAWERVNTRLREQARQAVGREPMPTAGILDSPSVTTSEAGGERGYDGGKRCWDASGTSWWTRSALC